MAATAVFLVWSSRFLPPQAVAQKVFVFVPQPDPNKGNKRRICERKLGRGETGSAIVSEGSGIREAMESLLGLLRVRIIRGVNLAVRDTSGSDPYIVLRMGRQKLKTSVKKNNVNPEWNENLTLSVSEPLMPIKLQVYDKDRFSRDDKMGDAEFDITAFIEAVKMGLSECPNGTVITTVRPCRQNCLAGESPILWKDGNIIQDIVLRLRNVETGEIELQLTWIDIPGAPGF